MRNFFTTKKKENPTLAYLQKAENLSDIKNIADQLRSKQSVVSYRYKDDVIHIINEEASLYHIVNTTAKMEKLAAACSTAEEGVMLDIGANIGLFSFFYKKINPGVQAYLFEPDERLHPIINRNLSSFSKFEIVNSAVGAESGPITFLINPHSSQTNSILREALLPFANKETIVEKSISAVSLVDFCRQRDITKINTLKIDIQGAEFDALKNSGDVLQITQEALVEICFLMPNVIPLIKLIDRYFSKNVPVSEIIMGADLKFYN